jgi:hypothetical protein
LLPKPDSATFRVDGKSRFARFLPGVWPMKYYAAMCNVYPCGMDVLMNQTELFQECAIIGHIVNSQRLI